MTALVATAAAHSGGRESICAAKPRWRPTKSAHRDGPDGRCASSLVVRPARRRAVLRWSRAGVASCSATSPSSSPKDIPIRSRRRRARAWGRRSSARSLITVAATLIAVPLGILGAIYLNEYGGQRRSPGSSASWRRHDRRALDRDGPVHLRRLDRCASAISAFGGALALACLMLPIVIRSVEEMLRLVPDHLREASFALGARKSRTILTVVLPAALPGIMCGCLLAVARAAGETAPLLFTIGVVTATNPNLFTGAPTPRSRTQIFANANSPFAGAQQRAWGAALTLILIVFAFTVVARVISARFALKR